MHNTCINLISILFCCFVWAFPNRNWNKCVRGDVLVKIVVNFLKQLWPQSTLLGNKSGLFGCASGWVVIRVPNVLGVNVADALGSVSQWQDVLFFWKGFCVLVEYFPWLCRVKSSVSELLKRYRALDIRLKSVEDCEQVVTLWHLGFVHSDRNDLVPREFHLADPLFEGLCICTCISVLERFEGDVNFIHFKIILTKVNHFDSFSSLASINFLFPPLQNFETLSKIYLQWFSLLTSIRWCLIPFLCCTSFVTLKNFNKVFSSKTQSVELI